MTPVASAAARSHARRAGAALPRRVVPPAPRRLSGPSRAAPRRGAAAPSPLILSLSERASRLVDHPVLDRLIRGQGWIAIVAFALIGIVGMQVALLKLNTGISRSVERVSALQREQAALEAQLSTLASGDRVQTVAAQKGMVYDPAGDVRYLTFAANDALRASRALTAGLAQPLSQSALVAAASAGATTATAATAATATTATGASTASASSTAPAPSGAAVASGTATTATPTSATATPTSTTAAPTATTAAPSAASTTGSGSGAGTASGGATTAGTTTAGPATAGAASYPTATGRP